MPDKFAVSVTGAGSQTVVPAPVQAGGLTTAFIRVLSYHLSASATSTVTHESSVSSTVLCTDYLGTASPVSELDADGGVYDVPPGEGLVIASTGGNVGGCGRYTVIQGVRVNRAITLPNTPQNLTIPVISGTTTVSQVLTTTNGTWNNSPTGYAYQWYSNGVPVGTNANTYTLVSADTGNFITVVVTASNANGSGTATSAAVGPVTTLVPVNTVAPVVSGSTVEPATLTTTNGTWTNTPTSFAYQWNSGGVNVGTNANTYTTTAGDIGNTITCTVTASNANGPGAPATSNAVGPITGGGGGGPSLDFSVASNSMYLGSVVF